MQHWCIWLKFILPPLYKVTNREKARILEFLEGRCAVIGEKSNEMTLIFNLKSDDIESAFSSGVSLGKRSLESAKISPITLVGAEILTEEESDISNRIEPNHVFLPSKN